jgi:hypothetical protein
MQLADLLLSVTVIHLGEDTSDWPENSVALETRIWHLK